MDKKLTTEKEVIVRFNEVDSLGIVWHGHFVKYLEDGREDFGAKHGLTYLDFKDNEHAIPLVKVDIDYKRIVAYGDRLRVITTFVDSPAAKLIFEYKLYRLSDNELVATGKTIQVFTTFDHELCYVPPEFFLAWKRKVGLL